MKKDNVDKEIKAPVGQKQAGGQRPQAIKTLLYSTSDGKLFYLEGDAQNHAQSLEDKKVVKINQ